MVDDDDVRFKINYRKERKESRPAAQSNYNLHHNHCPIKSPAIKIITMDLDNILDDVMGETVVQVVPSKPPVVKKAAESAEIKPW
jgi:hypothetical protein